MRGIGKHRKKIVPIDLTLQKATKNQPRERSGEEEEDEQSPTLEMEPKEHTTNNVGTQKFIEG